MIKIAFIDIDGTLVKGQTQVYLIRYLFRARLINLFTLVKVMVWYFKYKYFNSEINEAMAAQIYLNLLQGKKKLEVKKIIDSYFISLTRFFYPSSKKLIRNLHKEGFQIVLLSATIAPISKKIQDYFEADKVISTELELKGNRYTGKIMGKINHGAEKAKRVKKYLLAIKEKHYTAAFADNFSDLDILLMVERPVAVNPEKKLKEFALKNNWEIIKL